MRQSTLAYKGQGGIVGQAAERFRAEVGVAHAGSDSSRGDLQLGVADGDLLL